MDGGRAHRRRSYPATDLSVEIANAMAVCTYDSATAATPSSSHRRHAADHLLAVDEAGGVACRGLPLPMT
jgi:hypothetical protein